MTNVILCNRPMNLSALANACGDSPEYVRDARCHSPNHIQPYSPYLFSDQTPNDRDRAIMALLSPQTVAKPLTELSLALGNENTLALAEINKKLMDSGLGFMGASTSLYNNRVSAFTSSVKDYQDALLAYRKTIKGNPALKIAARQRAQTAFTRMQTGFRHEIDSITVGIRARRGMPLTSARRAINIANSSRNVSSLHVSNQVQASNLVKFTQHASYLGNGLAIIDFGTRVGNIHNSYTAGGEWERDLFIESSSFAVSAATGVATAKLGAAALTVLVAATPVGWVGLVIGGIAVAGVSAATAMGANHIVRQDAGGVYDKIMNWISSL